MKLLATALLALPLASVGHAEEFYFMRWSDTEELTAEQLFDYAMLSVDCGSQDLRITLPSDVYQPRTPYVILDSLTGEPKDYDSEEIKTISKTHPIMNNFGSTARMDIWLGSSGDKRYDSPNPPEQEGHCALTNPDSGCGWFERQIERKVVFIRWPMAGDTYTIEIGRDRLWGILAERKEDQEAYDNRVPGAKSESQILFIAPIHVLPGAPEFHRTWDHRYVTSIAGPIGYIRFAAYAWPGRYLFGQYKRIGSPIHTVKRTSEIYPIDIRWELERLQDYYNTCSELPIQEPEPLTLTPSAQVTQASVRDLRATDEWSDYQDLTLDSFASIGAEDE